MRRPIRPPGSRAAAVLALWTFLALGCDDGIPDPRPGEPMATGDISGFWWMGPSDGLAYVAAGGGYEPDLRIVDLATGTDTRIAPVRWDPPVATPPGGAPAVYYVEELPGEDAMESRILRATAGGAPDTVIDGLPWVSSGLAVTSDESRLAFMMADSVAVLDRAAGARWSWPVWGTDAVFSPDGSRLLVLYRWDFDQKLVDVAGGEVPVFRLRPLAIERNGTQLPVTWDGQDPRMLYVTEDGAVRDYDLLTGESDALFTLPDDALPGGLAWSPDGDRVAYRTSECADTEFEFFIFESHCVEWVVRTMVWNRSGRKDVVAISITAHLGWEDLNARFSPDGSRLAYVGPTESEFATRTLYVVDLR